MTWDNPFGDDLLSSELIGTLRDRLDEHGYAEDQLCELLGLDALTLREESSRDLLIARLRRSDEPLSVLARFFFLRDLVSFGELEPIFAAPELDALLEHGLVAREGEDGDPGLLRATVGMTPCWDVMITSDPLWQPEEAEFGPGGPVMVPGGDTEVLLRCTPRAPVDHVLDIGTGPGPHALAATVHAVDVVGLDIAKRALAFSGFNARLNGIENVQLTLGDITGEAAIPRENEGRYDLVLANPPFVPTLHKDVLYRDGGGPLGDEVLNTLIGRLEGLLKPGGHARIVADVAFCEGESLETKLRNVLGDAFDRFDIIGVEDRPFDLGAYAESHATRLVDGRIIRDPGGGESLLAHYEGLDITRIALVLFAFRRTNGGGKRLFRVASSLFNLGTTHLDRIFDLWERLRTGGAAETVLSSVPRPAPDVTLVYRRHLAGQRPDTFEIEFGSDSPWLNTRVNQELFDLLAYCGGGSSSGQELVEALKREKGIPESAARGFVVNALPSLAGFGVIDL